MSFKEMCFLLTFQLISELTLREVCDTPWSSPVFPVLHGAVRQLQFIFEVLFIWPPCCVQKPRKKPYVLPR